MSDMISRSALKSFLCKCCNVLHSDEPCEPSECNVMEWVDELPAVDAVEVVRCKECKHGVWNEDEEMYQCVEGADYDPELAMYHGFICYEEADFFCKRGERRAGDATN
jgi:hypothetical protein